MLDRYFEGKHEEKSYGHIIYPLKSNQQSLCLLSLLMLQRLGQLFLSSEALSSSNYFELTI